MRNQMPQANYHRILLSVSFPLKCGSRIKCQDWLILVVPRVWFAAEQVTSPEKYLQMSEKNCIHGETRIWISHDVNLNNLLCLWVTRYLKYFWVCSSCGNIQKSLQNHLAPMRANGNSKVGNLFTGKWISFNRQHKLFYI